MRYGIASRRMRVSLPTIRKLGTLAHNRQFSPSEFAEYTGQPAAMVAAMVRRGILTRVAPAAYYPTARGWAAIERAYRMS